MMVGTARVFMLVAEIMFQKLLNIPCIKAGQDIKNKNKKNMNLIKLKQLDQTELTTFIGTVNDPLYINNPSGYLTFASGVVMTTGNQIISGNKTFSGILFGSGGWSISGGDFLINYEKHWDNIVNTAAVSKRAVDAKFIPLTGNATTEGYPNLISGMTASIGMRGSTSFIYSSSIYPVSLTIQGAVDVDDAIFTTTGLDTKNRRLLDGFQINRGTAGARPGGVHFNFQDKKLIDSIGLKSVDWDMRRLFVTDGVAYTGIDSTVYSLDYQTRKLNSTGNSIAVDWGGRTLYDSSSAPSVNWSDSKLYTSNGVYSTAGTPSVDWSNRILYDFDEFKSVDWSLRQLIDDQEDLSIEWQFRELLDENAATSVKWHSRELKDTNDNTTVNWNNSNLVKNSEVLLDWSKNSGIQIQCLTGLNNTPFKPVNNSNFSFSLDQVNNKMNLIVKYSDGTIKSGSISLSS